MKAASLSSLSFLSLNRPKALLIVPTVYNLFFMNLENILSQSPEGSTYRSDEPEDEETVTVTIESQSPEGSTYRSDYRITAVINEIEVERSQSPEGSTYRSDHLAAANGSSMKMASQSPEGSTYRSD